MVSAFMELPREIQIKRKLLTRYKAMTKKYRVLSLYYINWHIEVLLEYPVEDDCPFSDDGSWCEEYGPTQHERVVSKTLVDCVEKG